ncbi:MAG: type II secretion system F family protein [Acidimicrobiia bacterium]
MSGPTLIAAAAIGICFATGATFLVPPTRRLAPRLRPYLVVTRARLGRSADLIEAGHGAPGSSGGVLARLFGPPTLAAVRTLGRLVRSQSDDALALRLRQAGFLDDTPEAFRLRQVSAALATGVAGVVIGAVLARSVAVALVLGTCGVVIGTARPRSHLDRVIAERTERIRLELYTVNQLLAMHLRTGAGPIQAVQRVVDRGQGVVVEELTMVLRAVRAGTSETEAFSRAAALTPEPSAARTFNLFATGAQRGADLGVALLELSEDIRDAGREELRREATRRRATMLVPTIAVLAPVMLLFIAAPIPFVVFGAR